MPFNFKSNGLSYEESSGDIPAVINSLSVTPSTTTQTITAPSGVDGYSPITVEAVTASIDANIVAENIKNGVEILNIVGNYEGEGGGGGSEEIGGDGKYLIQVLDYDGSILKAYWCNSGDTFTLPAQPDHTDLGMTFVSFDAPSVITVTNNSFTVPAYDVTIGAVYTPTSGKSEFDIVIETDDQKTVKFGVSGSKDWGDGTTNSSTSHTYATTGSYTIKTSATTLAGYVMDQSGQALRNETLRAVRLTNIDTINENSLRFCYRLRTVTFDHTCTKISGGAFEECGLTGVVCPNTITSIGNNAFKRNFDLKRIALINYNSGSTSALLTECPVLESVALQGTINTVSSYFLSRCVHVKRVRVPSTITTVNTYAFDYNYGTILYDFSSCTSVPTLSGTNAFSFIGAPCKILVPANKIGAWKTATNWSTYKDYIVSSI